MRPESTTYCVVMDMWPGSLNCCVFHLSNGDGRVCLERLQGLFFSSQGEVYSQENIS